MYITIFYGLLKGLAPFSVSRFNLLSSTNPVLAEMNLSCFGKSTIDTGRSGQPAQYPVFMMLPPPPRAVVAGIQKDYFLSLCVHTVCVF